LAKKTNDERAVAFEAEIAEHDEKQKAKGRIFNPQLLMHRAGQIHEVEHPVLGLLRYGELTFEDSFEINNCKTDVEKTEMVAYLMLSKAYPNIPKDFLKRMPLVEGAALIDFLTKQPTFLSQAKRSPNGLKTTCKHKNSATRTSKTRCYTSSSKKPSSKANKTTSPK
jgi:hypothetical protein